MREPKHRNRHQSAHQPWDDDDAPTDQEKCPVCNGKRKVPTVIIGQGGKQTEIMAWCPACGGDGKR